MATNKDDVILRGKALKDLRGIKDVLQSQGDPFLANIMNRAIECIENQPAIGEMVHGRWIAVPSSDMITGKAYKCSECGKMRYGSYTPNYCAHCGTKMDGGTDNG